LPNICTNLQKLFSTPLDRLDLQLFAIWRGRLDSPARAMVPARGRAGAGAHPHRGERAGALLPNTPVLGNYE